MIRAESEAGCGATIGATVVALTFPEGHFLAFWAGDSRLYRLRSGEIELLTADHSLVGEMVLAGQLTWEEADLIRSPTPSYARLAWGRILILLGKVHGEVRAGDRFLLCSDGLTKYAGFEVLRRLLSSARFEAQADDLIQLALQGGGAAKISVIVVDVLS